MQPNPTLLALENFTPPQRTPWGGLNICNEIKDLPGFEGIVVGESWEISVEPDFPSQVAETGESLSALIRRNPSEWLGADVNEGSIGLLVKLLDAAAPLSVQIHPADDAPHLLPDESGKPESWYIVDHEPGAGLYLGLQPGVTEEGMRRAIEDGADVSALLYFVPVARGDCFAIAPGTAHAIGKGITLVEPQRVLPGRRGLTYRYWDWNRKYDSNGRPSADGAPRTLHLERALAATRWDAPRGEALLAEVRTRAGEPPKGCATLEPLLGTKGPVTSAVLDVSRLAGTGRLTLPDSNFFRGLTVVRGAIRFIDADITVSRGRSAALPASLRAPEIELLEAEAVLAAAPLSTCALDLRST